MANATLMAKAFGKRPDTWLKTDKAKEYAKAIALKSVITEHQMVVVRPGSSENGGGTWIHEKLVLRFAQAGENKKAPTFSGLAFCLLTSYTSTNWPIIINSNPITNHQSLD